MRPDKLPLFENRSILRAVIETPRGSRNKFDYHPKLKIFFLKKVLPAGMLFPFDFGFFPQTQGAAGDPLDVLVLMDEPAFPGAVVSTRLIGVLEAHQIEAGKSVRNDRYLAVAAGSHAYANVHHHRDLPGQLTRELVQFFVDYNRLEDRKFEVKQMRGPAAALKTLRASLIQESA